MQQVSDSYIISRESWDGFFKKAKKAEKKGQLEKAEKIYQALFNLKKNKKIKRRLDAILKEKAKDIKKERLNLLLERDENNDDENNILNIISEIVVDTKHFHSNIQEFPLDQDRIKIIIKISNILYLQDQWETFEKMWQYQEVLRLSSLDVKLKNYKGYCQGHRLIKKGELLSAYNKWSTIDYSLFQDDYLKLRNLLATEVENEIVKLLSDNDLLALKNILHKLPKLISWNSYIAQTAGIFTKLWKEERMSDILFCFSGQDFVFWDALAEDENLIKSYFNDSCILLNLESIFNIWARAVSYQFFNNDYQSTTIEKRDFAIVIPYLIENSFFTGNPQKVQGMAYDLIDDQLKKIPLEEDNKILYEYSKNKAKCARIFDCNHKGKKKWFMLSLLSQFIDNKGQKTFCSNFLTALKDIDHTILEEKDSKYLSDIFWPLDFKLSSLQEKLELAKSLFSDGKRILKSTNTVYGVSNIAVDSIVNLGEESLSICSIFHVLTNQEAKTKYNLSKLLKKLLYRFNHYEFWQISFIDFIEKNRKRIIENSKNELGHYLLLYHQKMVTFAPRKISDKYQVQSFIFAIEGIDSAIENTFKRDPNKQINYELLWNRIQALRQDYAFLSRKRFFESRYQKTIMHLTKNQIKRLIHERRFYQIRKLFKDSKKWKLSYSELKLFFFKELEALMYNVIGPGAKDVFENDDIYPYRLSIFDECLKFCLELDPSMEHFITREITEYSGKELYDLE